MLLSTDGAPPSYAKEVNPNEASLPQPPHHGHRSKPICIAALLYVCRM
jgi:hypothetical protein